MAGTHGPIAVALLTLFCVQDTRTLYAERAASSPTLEHPAFSVSGAVPRGAIRGVIRDEAGRPVAGARVYVAGLTGASVTTDRSGHYLLQGLPTGAYLLRVRMAGFVAPRVQFVSVRETSSDLPPIVLREAAVYPVLAAGVVPSETDAAAGPLLPEASGTTPGGDRGKANEAAWRMRHLRRSVLKSTTYGEGLLDDTAPAPTWTTASAALRRATDAPVRAAMGLFSDFPWSGQVNLLTAGTFDESPRRLADMLSAGSGVAYLRVGSSAGDPTEWSIQGALTSADISSWVLSGAYAARSASGHQYDLGVSYSTQQYSGGNPLALRDVTDGSRNVGSIRGYDRVTVAPGVALSYGIRYERYDYLDHGNLLSPRFGVELMPSWARIRADVSSRALAPGAEEFLPPGEAGLLLPPQRTFSAVDRGRHLHAERANQATVTVERDVAGTTLAVRGFRQRVSDQLATWFDATLPGEPAGELGHYLLANVGTVYATGWAASVHGSALQRLSGTLEYSSARTRLTTASGRPWWVGAPGGAGPDDGDRVQNISAAVEANVPESATRVTVTYRATTGLPTPPSPITGLVTRGSVDTRFDVQVRQSLPFLDSRTGRWEMLFLVRNFFREAGADQAVFDEMFVVKPPKRVVGGLSLYF